MATARGRTLPAAHRTTASQRVRENLVPSPDDDGLIEFVLLLSTRPGPTQIPDRPTASRSVRATSRLDTDRNFDAAWRVAMIYADLAALASLPELAQAVAADLTIRRQ